MREPGVWGGVSRRVAVFGVVALVMVFLPDVLDLPPAIEFIATVALLALLLARIALLVRDNEVQLRHTTRIEARHRSVLFALDEAVMLQDDTGRIVDANPAAVRLFGRKGPVTSVEDVVPTLDLVHLDGSPLDPSDRPGRIAMQTGIAQRGTVVGARRADGSMGWYEVNAIPLEPGLAAVGRSVVSSFSDVTERSANAQRLAEATAEAKRAAKAADDANQAKNEFLSRMSHELRTPLNAVLGFGQLLGMDELSENQSDSVHQIMTAGEHLLGLINEVLEISKIESGNAGVSIGHVPLRDAVTGAVDLVWPAAEAAGIVIRVAPGSLATACVAADRSRLIQVLVNVLTNAVKYNRPSGSIDITCERMIEFGRGRVRVVITDTGVGIAPELIDRVFVPFDRLGAETSMIEGTGIGLSLSRALVEQMNGSMGVHSTPGHGSRFWIELDDSTPSSAPEQSRASTDFSLDRFHDAGPITVGTPG